MKKTNKINVGANASVCPKTTKTNPKKFVNRINQPAAITLVALVITVIILIILAGVSLNLALGQNGIFTKSKEAVDKYKDSAQREQNEMDNLYNTLVGLDKKGDDDVTQGDDPTTGEPVDYSQLKIGDYVNYPVKYDNVGTSVDNSTGNVKGYYPRDEYANKWRIISIDEAKHEVKLVSAGVPLSYYHPYESGGAPTSVTNLTTNFFSTEIQCGKESTEKPTQYQFYQSGFKDGDSGNYVTGISKVKELFNNDDCTKKTNGTPEVQSMTKNDLDAVYKGIMGEDKETSSGTYVNDAKFKDLLAVPCKEDESDEYAMTWLASADNAYYLWRVGSYGSVSTYYDHVRGVRSIVSLESNIKFTKASSDTNGTTTWNISK